MPKIVTPASRRADARAHAKKARAAAQTVGQLLDREDFDPEAILEAAKTIEAAGCYIRRANAAGF